jgi:hypothetical protein
MRRIFFPIVTPLTGRKGKNNFLLCFPKNLLDKPGPVKINIPPVPPRDGQGPVESSGFKVLVLNNSCLSDSFRAYHIHPSLNPWRLPAEKKDPGKVGLDQMGLTY